MTTDTPPTDAEPSNQPMLSAKSDPVELYHKLNAVIVDFGKALDACVEYRNQLAASKAEVADLKQALEIANRSADDQMFQKREAESEVERLRKHRYPFQSFEQFCNFLTSTNLIEELAVSDPEGWDGGAELSRIETAFDRYLDQTNQ